MSNFPLSLSSRPKLGEKQSNSLSLSLFLLPYYYHHNHYCSIYLIQYKNWNQKFVKKWRNCCGLVSVHHTFAFFQSETWKEEDNRRNFGDEMRWWLVFLVRCSTLMFISNLSYRDQFSFTVVAGSYWFIAGVALWSGIVVVSAEIGAAELRQLVGRGREGIDFFCWVNVERFEWFLSLALALLSMP